MLSQTVEYALRAVVHLANVAPDAATTDQIAQVTRVPKAYLSKVLQSLVRGGIVRSQRGLGGGMTLAKAPSKLTLLDVVNAVEPIQRIRTCPLGLPSHGARLCPLHRRLDDALAQVETAFGRTVLGELLAEPSSSVPLCEFPDAAASQPAAGRRGRPAAARRRSG
jgi:Rrf2 family protein